MISERPAKLTRRQAANVADAEMGAFYDVLVSLDAGDWALETGRDGVTVRAVVAHVCGQYQEIARPATLLRRIGLARRRYPERGVLDGRDQVRLDDLASLDPDALVAHFARYGPAAIRAMRRMPGLLRRVPAQKLFPDSSLAEPDVGYLVDVIAPRDTWIHRLELARATGVVFEVDVHDEAIVAQVVRDLHAGWHGRPLRLELAGPAGGAWSIGRGPAIGVVQADALGMMRHLAGRDGLDLPEGSPLEGARVVF